MKPPRTANPKSRSTPPRGRRGLIVGLLLVAMVFTTGFLALGVNAIRLRQVQTQLRNTCRSTALAGAAELLNEGCLSGRADVEDDWLAARLAACGYAQLNPVDGLSVRLDTNTSNNPTGDIVLGYVDPCGPVGQPIELSPTAMPYGVNTVRVTARMSRNLANRVTLWFGNFVGMTSADVAVSAQASLDQRIVGFRPEPGVKVPVSPLIAEYAPWWEQATAVANPELNDLYAVNPQTGEVTAGPDGIPEILLACSAQSSAVQADGAAAATARCAPLMLWNELDLSYVWSVRAREGLSLGDLRDYGGALITYNGATPVGVESGLAEELPYGLMDTLGQVRAWSLGEPSSTNKTAWTLLGFGAGRIVAVRRVDKVGTNPTWNFVIQPATLVCSQAVADVAGASNPWIAKLELTQ